MKVLFLIISVFTISFSQYSGANEGRDLREKADELKMKLGDDEVDVLKNGELGTGRYVIGGVLGTYPLGLGIGHVIQGRWGTSGWKFTAGELLSVGAITIGASKCVSDVFSNGFSNRDCKGSGLMSVGIVGLVGFRIWEIIDVWYGGYRQMEDYTYLRNKIEKNEKTKTSFYVLPNLISNGAGLSFGMTF